MPLPGRAQPTFCIVDPSLRDFVGHHFAYDEAVGRGAAEAGLRVVTLGHHAVSGAIADTMRVVRCFRRDMWANPPLARWLPAGLRTAGSIVLANRDFLRDLKAGLAGVPMPEGSILFAHMIFRHQLPALARFVRDQPPRGPITAILLLRYQAAFYDNPACARAFRMLEQAAAEGKRVRLASDSTRLSLELGRLTHLPIEVMPIPHTSEPAAMPPRPDGAPLRFVSLGNARDEKGYVEILDAIRLLRTSGDLDHVEFVLQSNDAAPGVQAAIDAFAPECPPNVTLLRDALSPREYEAQLRAADAILVPYWRDIYHARTSGVFLEAVAAGKVVIATRNTWMSDELTKYGAGVLVDDHDPHAIAEAIRSVVRDHARLVPLAEAGRAACLAWHSPAALIRQAIEGPRPSDIPERKIRRLAVLYPWGDFENGRTGAALRVNLLVDKLAPLVEEVRVLQDGPWAVNTPTSVRLLVTLAKAPLRLLKRLVSLSWHGGRGAPPARHANRSVTKMGALGESGLFRELPKASHFRDRSNVSVEMATLRIRHHILRRIYRALFRRLLGNAGYGQEMMLWFHLERHLDRGFARQIDEIVTWADVVLLEYPFWAGVVAPLCEIRGRKLILTNHDVLHAQVTASRPLRWITRRMEMRGLATADQVVSVSPNDQRTFAKAGIASIVIPNPVDTGKLGGDMPGDLRRFLSALCHIDLPPGPVCFFVGSNFGPNVGAAMRLRGIAAAMAGDATPPLFVIAGACAPPERSGNFIALGRVDDFALTLLYHLAQIIAIPLSEGTGSSIKTVEALAARRPVLGTNIAFRGLTISPGVDCIVEDSFQEWPTHIRALLADPERAAALAAMARETAAAYDYRLIYAAYLPLIGLPPEEAARSVKPGLGLPDNLVVLCQARGILGSVMPLLTSPDQRCTPGNDALLRDVMIAGAIDNNVDVVMEARMALAALDAPVVGPLTGHYGPASIAVLRLLDKSHAL